MSLPLTAAEEETYKAVIDNILATADLETVTRKRIRAGLETAVGRSLGEKKEAIKRLIETRFDAITSANGAMPTPPTMPLLPSDGVRPSPKRDHNEMMNGHGHRGVKEENEDDDEDEGEEDQIRVSLPPAKKKQKRESSLDDDAKLAAQLQAQENQLARARTTRGGGSAKPGKANTKKKRSPKKKSKAKASEDSDGEGSGGDGAAPEKRKAGGGFQKPFNLSYSLALLCGESVLPRPQVVKKLWEHIKANNLQDPKDKRQIICDDAMHAVFKQAKVDMFQMNKMIGNHLYPVEEE